ncbi:4-hydroxy-tetrahydrodipicolinate synthase [Diplonema papillatum]|nr:4-hydroxy-tetrahydrodipicolinate synthase [Diplonema papillatum]
MIDWMGGLASAAPSTPFYYYHIPVITGVPATISVKKFLEEGGPLIPTLHGVKYTSTNLAEMADVASVGHGKYDVMAGLGEQMLAALAMGAESAVSAPFNVPFAMGYYHRIQEQFAKGDMKEALKLQKKINQFSYVLQWGGYGHPISTMRAIIRHEKGLEFGSPRLPLKAMSAESAKKLCDELKGLGFLA